MSSKSPPLDDDLRPMFSPIAGSCDHLFREIYERTPAMLHVTDRNGRVQAVSDVWLEKLGYERDEVLGLPIAHFMDEALQKQIGTILERVFRTGRMWEEARRFVCRNGRMLEVLASAHPIRDASGQIDHLLVALHDVTDRNRAEHERTRALAEIERLKEELKNERDYLREELVATGRFGEIVGDSPKLRQVVQRIGAVASTPSNVLISGESGVGKELVARAIHRNSPRADGPLVKVNCASVPRELFESEFFGHVKGAFTGAHRDRIGRFELANGGTLFLDEVGEVPLELQAKLLRVLQERELERVGDHRTRKTDVRIVAATNRDLEQEVAAGRFRNDLYYRLTVFPIEVPPLRQRREDIVPLALHFLRLHTATLQREGLALRPPQIELLLQYSWPGNVRELENVIERAVILSPAGRLQLEAAMPEGSRLAKPEAANGAAPDPPATRAAINDTTYVTAEEFRRRERLNLIAALAAANWRISGEEGAAKLLGMRPTTLASKIKSMGIQRP